ncbi:unnamed protein product [Peronospora destructor]|uniref:Spen paralogue and orthologue SPOC C-terminal domain-containing protein n=1 Tax=Peronospora destructor TaxID=86335 RepID=A0AAV0VCG9_9STRA|nr:unnamed protein product [Peronospora destructor]
MEGKDSAKTRRGSGSAIYEKYLNIKNNALPREDEGVVTNAVEISNSTDEYELEAGEVYTAARLGVTIGKPNDGRDVTSPRREECGGSRSPMMRQPLGPMSPPRMMGGPMRRRSRSRSRSRGRNGNSILDVMNGGDRPWLPPQGSPGNGYFGDGRSPRGAFGRRPGSPGGRRGNSPSGGFDRRPGSPPRGGYNQRPGSPQCNGFGGGCSPPRGDFDRPRECFRRNGPFGGPRGRSLPHEDFRRGRSMSPEGGGLPRDFRNSLGPGRDSPRGGMMGGPWPPFFPRLRPRRSRSRSPFFRGSPPRGPPRNGNVFGPPDRRPWLGSPGRMGMSEFRSLPRDGFDGCGPGGLPPFEDRGPPNMFRPRGRSRSPNQPPPSEMMRKRDRSWERGGPPPNHVELPFNGPLPDSPSLLEARPFDTPSEWNFELKRSGKFKCRCSATSLSVGISRQLPLFLDVVTLPHLKRTPEFLQLDRPTIRRVVYELKPESMADASGYREFVDYLIQGRSGHARAGAATEMESQGFKIFLLPPGQAARQIGYKGDHMIAVLRSR